jgi:hypothetical protein
MLFSELYADHVIRFVRCKSRRTCHGCFPPTECGWLASFATQPLLTIWPPFCCLRMYVIFPFGAKPGPCWQSRGFILLSVCTFRSGSFAVMPHIDPLVAVSPFSASTWSVLVVEIFLLTISVFLFCHQDVCTLFCLPQNPLLTFSWPYLAQRVRDLVCCGTTCWPLDGLFPPLGSMWSDIFAT